MKKIYKYPLAATGFQTVSMPIASQVLSVHEQKDHIVVYALVDIPDNGEDTALSTKHFKVIGTGHSIDTEEIINYEYVGTVKLLGGTLMYHVFVREEPI